MNSVLPTYDEQLWQHNHTSSRETFVLSWILKFLLAESLVWWENKKLKGPGCGVRMRKELCSGSVTKVKNRMGYPNTFLISHTSCCYTTQSCPT